MYPFNYFSVTSSTFTLLCNHPHQSFLTFANWNSVPIKHQVLIRLPPHCWQPPSAFCLHESDYARDFIKWNHSAGPVVAGLFHLAWCLHDDYVFLQLVPSLTENVSISKYFTTGMRRTLSTWREIRTHQNRCQPQMSSTPACLHPAGSVTWLLKSMSASAYKE